MERGGKPHGFAGQVLQMIPSELKTLVRSTPALCDFVFTDIGRYPRAYRHYYRRPHGAEEQILIVCERGHGWVRIDERDLALGPDRFMIIPAGVAHEYWAAHDDPWTISWCHFKGVRCDVFSLLTPTDKAPFAIDADLIDRVRSLFTMAFDIVQRGYTLYHVVAASSLVHSILSLLIYDNARLNPLQGHVRNRHVEKAIAYIGANIDRALSLADIAHHVGLSISRLTQLFSSLVGLAPMSYLARERIYRACHYLNATELPVATVAQMVGYKDPFYFSRVFKRTIGIAPRRYRRQEHVPPPQPANRTVPDTHTHSRR